MFDATHGVREAMTIMRFPDELNFDAELAQASCLHVDFLSWWYKYNYQNMLSKLNKSRHSV